MSSRRANPFRSQNRENFPPLDEFFDDHQSSGLDVGHEARIRQIDRSGFRQNLEAADDCDGVTSADVRDLVEAWSIRLVDRELPNAVA